MMHGCDSHLTVGYSEIKDACGAVDEMLRDEGRSEGRNRDRLSSAYSASYCLSVYFSFSRYCSMLAIVFSSGKFV